MSELGRHALEGTARDSAGCDGEEGSTRRLVTSSVDRVARSLISKVTSENYAVIAGQLVTLLTSDTQDVDRVARLLLRKALMEPTFLKCYVFLIKEITCQWRDSHVHGRIDSASFLQIILDVCKGEFEDRLALCVQQERTGGEVAADFRPPPRGQDDIRRGGVTIEVELPPRGLARGVRRPEGVTFTNHANPDYWQQKEFLQTVRLVGMLFVHGIVPASLLDYVVKCLVTQRVPKLDTAYFTGNVEEENLVPLICLMSGDATLVQPVARETTQSFLSRLAEELDMPDDLLGLVGANGSVLLDEVFGEHQFASEGSAADGSVLHVVVMPNLPKTGTVECLCSLIGVLGETPSSSTDNLTRFLPVTAPLAQPSEPVPPTEHSQRTDQLCMASRTHFVQRCTEHLTTIDISSLPKRFQFQVSDALLQAGKWQQHVRQV